MKKIKISNDIIIAKIKGQNKLTLCASKTVLTEVYDLITMQKHEIFGGDIEKYLSIGYFESLKGIMGKDLDKKSLALLYKYIQTKSFKKEFEETYRDMSEWVEKLGEVLDKCDN